MAGKEIFSEFDYKKLETEINGHIEKIDEIIPVQELDEILIDEYSKNKPFFPYQLNVYEWAKDKNKVGFFLEMRLGKTLITIRWLKRKIKDDPTIKRILILCPRTVIPVWERELADQGIQSLRINPKASRQLNKIVGTMAGWYVTNYECVTATDLDQMKWDAVVLDESNRIKAPDPIITQKLIAEYPNTTQRKKIIKEYLKDYRKSEPDELKAQALAEEQFEIWLKGYHNYFPDTKLKALLTGTPAPETLLDYYNQIRFLDIDLFDSGTWWKFRDKFFHAVGPNKYAPWPYLKETLAGEIANYGYVLKRQQVGMGSHKVYEKRFVDFEDNNYKEQYDEFELAWYNDMLETEWAIVSVGFLQQLAGGFPKPKEGRVTLKSEHKLDELKELCFGDDLKQESIVIWYKYVEEIDQCYKALAKEEKCYYIAGNTSDSQRLSIRDNFMAGKFRLLLCQEKTAMMGIDLSIADTAIYYSNEFGATARLQSEDRIIHPEKKSPVLYLDLITTGTIDSDIIRALDDKVAGQDAFLNRVIELVKERHKAA